jgi:hypothetical protein
MFTLKGTARLYAGATLALALAIPAMPAAGAQGNSDCANGREIALVNGRIHTMDTSNSVVSAVTIRNGKFVSAGTMPAVQQRPGASRSSTSTAGS